MTRHLIVGGITDRKCQSLRRDVFSQTISTKFRLNVPKKRRDVLALCNPSPLRRVLVLVEASRLFFRIGVCTRERA